MTEGTAGDPRGGNDPRNAASGARLPPIGRRAMLFLAIDLIVLVVAALIIGRERLDAMIALAVGSVFALAVVLRARGRDPRTPIDTA